MSPFVLTPRAEEDLDEIDDYVAERFGDAVAERVTERLFETLGFLAEQPAIGTPRPQWTSEEVLLESSLSERPFGVHGRMGLPRGGSAALAESCWIT